MKKRLGPSERLYPMPCALVVGGTMEEADVLAVAWLNIVSSTPPSIAMGLRRTRRTLELIRETGEFTVNFPSTSLVTEVDYCGLVSGRKHDKFAEAGLTREPAALVATPLITECPYNLECRVSESVEVGEYVVIIGEIVESHAEESVLDATGNKVDVSALDPIAYIAGSREYRGLSPKLADAFSIGKALAPVEDSE
jgi:flavin reductase (DIM6/NTAB) family NADH-FMN oxidoreductase RutF